MAKIEWLKAAGQEAHILTRGFAVREAADIVLLNVATHAAEALNARPVIHNTRRALSTSRRKLRHSDPGRLQQRKLYYHRTIVNAVPKPSGSARFPQTV